MAIEYRDGSFSDTMPLDVAMEKFVKELEEGYKPIRAFHVGSITEIEKEKDMVAIEKRLEDLEKRVRDLSPVKTFLYVPTELETLKYTKPY